MRGQASRSPDTILENALLQSNHIRARSLLSDHEPSLTVTAMITRSCFRKSLFPCTDKMKNKGQNMNSTLDKSV